MKQFVVTMIFISVSIFSSSRALGAEREDEGSGGASAVSAGARSGPARRDDHTNRDTDDLGIMIRQAINFLEKKKRSFKEDDARMRRVTPQITQLKIWDRLSGKETDGSTKFPIHLRQHILSYFQDEDLRKLMAEVPSLAELFINLGRDPAKILPVTTLEGIKEDQSFTRPLHIVGPTPQQITEWTCMESVVVLQLETIEQFNAFIENAARFKRLTSLNLSKNRIGAEGAKALAASEHLRNLTSLNLSNNRIGAEGATALAESEHLRNLTSLALGYNFIEDAGATALAGAEHLRNLTSLNLSGNSIGDEGVRALAASEHLRNLTSLNLMINLPIGDEGVTALAASEHLRNLTSLSLTGNYRIGDKGVKALAGAEHLRNHLTSLNLRLINSIGKDLETLLRTAFPNLGQGLIL